MALWESKDRRLLPRDAAGRFVGESFEGRTVDPSSFRGSWHHSGRMGAWTFRLLDGAKTYRLMWTGDRWTVTEDVSAQVAHYPERQP